MTFSNRVIISQAKKASLASPPTHIGWAVGIILLVLFDIDGSSFGNDYASIAPILQRHCVQCHGSTQREAGLRLDRAALLLAGGENGPVVLRKNSAASELVRRIRSAGDDRMPRKAPVYPKKSKKSSPIGSIPTYRDYQPMKLLLIPIRVCSIGLGDLFSDPNFRKFKRTKKVISPRWQEMRSIVLSWPNCSNKDFNRPP
jgi:hypothetical protein